MLVASEMSGLNTLGTLARDSIEVGFIIIIIISNTSILMI